MNNEQKVDRLNSLYEQLEKYEGKKDAISTRKRKEIRLKIKDLKNILTDEEFNKMLSERSEIDVGKCR